MQTITMNRRKAVIWAAIVCVICAGLGFMSGRSYAREQCKDLAAVANRTAQNPLIAKTTPDNVFEDMNTYSEVSDAEVKCRG